MRLTIQCGEDAPELLASVHELRIAAWEPIIGRSDALERFGLDEHDNRSWHCVLEDDTGEKLVAGGRLTVCGDLEALPESASFEPFADQMSLPLGVAGRLVVHPDHQNRGLAERIITTRLDLARDLELVEVWSETRREQVHGFVRHGYGVVGSSSDRSVVGDWEILRAPVRAV